MLDLLQLDYSAWRTSSAILSGGSALIAILVGIEQMSSSARTKNDIEWLRASIPHEKIELRREALEKKLVQSQARLIARQEVPLWYLSPILFWPVLVAITLYPISDKHDSLFGILLAAGGGLFIGLQLIRTTIRAYCERVRIYYQHCSGMYKFRPAELDILALMEGGTRKEFIQSGVLFVGTIFGFAALVVSIKHGANFSYVVILITSSSAIMLTCWWVKDYAFKLAGNPNGAMSVFESRVHTRHTVRSLAGPEISKQFDDIDRSLKIIEELTGEFDKATEAPIRAILSDAASKLSTEVQSIIEDLESLKNELQRSEDGSTTSNILEKKKRVDERVQKVKKHLHSIRMY